ncbi:hypothetical protein WJX72_008569 [[Myrmecia] bisecta]|uniref:Alcohol dehydrogenase n=1 Tax=[Myrmecia] bisecta TaxID=41462 RepID=A0AAW1QS26_9CHLO
MKALVFEGKGCKKLEERHVPKLQVPTDAVVKVLKTTICGTDLHILEGNVPTVRPGRVLGHEGIGVVHAVGSNVSEFRPGDHVIISCITACQKCEYCRRGMYSHCKVGGWVLGNTIDGTQAEYVRIPHADGGLHHLPKDVDEAAALMLSDVLPTGFECGVLNGDVHPGGSVAIVGAGPIGLAALLTAKLYSPADIIMVDRNEARLKMAKKLGATHTVHHIDVLGIDATSGKVKRHTDDHKGVDTAIEAVGVPETFELCQQIIAPGGTIANVGVHGHQAPLHLDRLWDHNITIRTRLVDTVTTPRLLKSICKCQLDPLQLVTHRSKLAYILDAYDTFEHASENKALKVVIDV